MPRRLNVLFTRLLWFLLPFSCFRRLGFFLWNILFLILLFLRLLLLLLLLFHLLLLLLLLLLLFFSVIVLLLIFLAHCGSFLVTKSL